MALFLAQRWRRQPSFNVGINWAHATAQSLQLSTAFGRMHTRSGDPLPPDAGSALPAIKSCPGGIGPSFGGGLIDYVRFNTHYTISGTSACTLELLFYGTSFPSLSAIAGLTTILGTPDGSYDGGANNGAIRAYLCFVGSDPCNLYWWGASNDYDSGIATEVNKLQHVFLTKAAGTGAVQITAYRNGSQVAQGTSTNTGAFVTSGPYFLLGGGHSSRSTTMNGVVLKAALYDTILPSSQIVEKTLNPWIEFVPSNSKKIFIASNTGIKFDAAANSGYQAASSSYTFNRTCTGSNLYLSVDVALLSAGQTVTSVVDDNGGGNVAMTFLGAKSTVTSFGRIECWGLVAPATGTKQIQVNLSGSIASSAEAVSYTGVHQTSSVEAFNSAQATNVGAADATVTITPVANNCWIHAAVATDDTSVTANQTTRNNVTGAGGSGANEDTGPISPAAATAMSYTGVGALATWAIAGYALRPVAAAGAVLARIYAFVMG